MAEITLVLSNARPLLAAGAYEHLFPEKNPKWCFAQFHDNAQAPDTALAGIEGGVGALVLTAMPLSGRLGGTNDGPVALWVVLTNAVEGKEAEFNDWYDNRHIHDSLAIPGFVAARRYRVTATTGAESARWAYLALYEIELHRAAESLAEAAARAGGPKMPNPGYLAPGTAALPFKPVV